jgi:hypothetical protein
MVDLSGFCHVAFALGAFRGEQMPARGVLPANFPRASDLEPLGDGFPGFAARDRLWHKARKITQPARVTTAFASLQQDPPLTMGFEPRGAKDWRALSDSKTPGAYRSGARFTGCFRFIYNPEFRFAPPRALVRCPSGTPAFPSSHFFSSRRSDLRSGIHHSVPRVFWSRYELQGHF